MYMNIYQEEILEHYKHPHNHGSIENADIVQKERNASCGDELTFYLVVQDGKIVDVKFEGQGCAISQATASQLTDKVKGMTEEQVNKLTKQDILDMLQIDLSPTRLKCALLSLQGVKHALEQKYE